MSVDLKFTVHCKVSSRRSGTNYVSHALLVLCRIHQVDSRKKTVKKVLLAVDKNNRSEK